MLPFLEFGTDGKEQYISGLFEYPAQRFALPEQDQKAPLPGGRDTRYKNRMCSTHVHLGQAKPLESTGSSQFCIAERKHQLKNTKPKRVDLNVLSQFTEFQKSRTKNNQDEAVAQAFQDSKSAQSPEGSLETSQDLACQQLG